MRSVIANCYVSLPVPVTTSTMRRQNIQNTAVVALGVVFDLFTGAGGIDVGSVDIRLMQPSASGLNPQKKRRPLSSQQTRSTDEPSLERSLERSGTVLSSDPATAACGEPEGFGR